MIPGVSSLILPLPVFKAETQKMCRKTFYVVSVVMDSAADKRYAAYQVQSRGLKNHSIWLSNSLAQVLKVFRWKQHLQAVQKVKELHEPPADYQI